ncbi:MAG: HEAT repeat domain-containing protein [Cytophagales bacterium]|nr:HEAT repeat domain-containing protein [Armatimonadota bacterium]
MVSLFPFRLSPCRRAPLSLAAATVLIAVFGITRPAQAQAGGRAANPFAPPQATVQTAPQRDYDLQHLAVTLTVNAAQRTFTGTAVNTLTPLRGSLPVVRLHCGTRLKVLGCSVDGREAAYKRSGYWLLINPAAAVAAGTKAAVTVRYAGGNQQAASFGEGEGGFHWIRPSDGDPSRVGFWTQGESDGNRNWAPTWDYPNDFATTETVVTVPQAWSVIGNGTQVSDTTDPQAGTRTTHWKMDKPHATYLLSLVSGPFDRQTDRWKDVPLLYVVPKGKGDLIPDSFGDTGDMLTFFSRITGVKYPWAKYAQNAMYDFGGGMENISASTLDASALTDARSGFRRMAGLNSHELAHQWFGDYVTCENWGETWLNESFATFFQMLYFEHSRGKNAYDQEIEDATQDYLSEASRYKRPIVTNVYPNPDAMFDRHAYPKGGVVLHTLRRLVGDKAFFAGINRYLTTNAHQPVETPDLIKAMNEASGRDLKPFFDQWLYKPGHPVLNYFWTYDEAAKAVVLTVQQRQDTSGGTPLYRIPNVQAGLIVSGKLQRVSTPLTGESQQVFRLPAQIQPDSVLLDPDHDFLREIPTQQWSTRELPAILQFAPNGGDRTLAMRRLLDPKNGPISDVTVALAAETLRADQKAFAALGDLTPLSDLKRESLRPLLRELSARPGFENDGIAQDRRTEAILALGNLTKTQEDTALLRSFVGDTGAPYGVVAAAVETLGAWDANANLDLLQKAARMDSRGEVIRKAAFAALAGNKPEIGTPILVTTWGAVSKSREVRRAALEAMGALPAAEPKSTAVLREALRSKDSLFARSAAEAIGERNDRALLPDLKAFTATPPQGTPRWLQGVIRGIIAKMERA